MSLPTKDFTTLVREQAAMIQGAAKALIDLTVGSILRAVIEANAAVILWVQGLFLQVLAKTRAATCSGADLDSWMADYGIYRLAAVASTGNVTFSRFTTTQAATIPVGTIIESTDLTPEQFAVVADTTNPAYSSAHNAYVIAAGVAFVTVPVVCQTAGVEGNVLAGQISLLTSSIQGIDTASNASAFVNGMDAETDDGMRARFVAYIAGLNRGTKGAVAYAVSSAQQGASYTLVENYNYAGQAQAGFFYVIADDGSGSPTSGFLSNVFAAIEAIRPLGSTFAVYGPTKVVVAATLTITTASGYSHSAVAALVNAALQTYISSLPVGQSLNYSRIAQIAYDASPGVINVTAVTLNSATADITATGQQVIKPGTITVN